MYGMKLGSAEYPLFYEGKGTRIDVFSLTQAKAIIDGLLNRKARNNGVGRHLLNELRTKGFSRHDFSTNWKSLGFFAQAVTGDRHEIRLFGEMPDALLNRLNSPWQTAAALAATRGVRAERRRLRALGLYQDPVRTNRPRSLAGASGKLKQHFRNSRITCADAISVIAHAARLDRSQVQRRLMDSLDERGVATLRLTGGFVFRVDLAHGYRGFLDLSAPVELRATNDNSNAVHRRLRKALRTRLNRERKARRAAALDFRAQRHQRRLQQLRAA